MSFQTRRAYSEMAALLEVALTKWNRPVEVKYSDEAGTVRISTVASKAHNYLDGTEEYRSAVQNTIAQLREMERQDVEE